MGHRQERKPKFDMGGLKSLVEGALKGLKCVADGRMPETQDLVNFVQAVKLYSSGETESMPGEFRRYDPYGCLGAFLEQRPLDRIVEAYAGVLNPNASPGERNYNMTLAEKTLKEFMDYIGKQA